MNLPVSAFVNVRCLRVVHALAAFVVALATVSSAPTAPAFTEPTAFTEPAVYRCNFVHSPPVIDGLGSDECWDEALPIRNFRKAWLGSSESNGSSGASQLEVNPSSKTVAKLLWDREYIYVWAKLEDSDLQAALTERDEQTWLDDCFEMFLKPSEKHPGYYEFHVTPANTQMDLYIPERSQKAYALYKSAHDFEFTSAVHAEGTIDDRTDEDRSWQVEFRIAWKDFYRTGGAPVPDEVWSFSLCRYDYDHSLDKPELTSISPLTQPSFHRHEEFVGLRFVGPQQQGLVNESQSTQSFVLGSPDPPAPFSTQRVPMGFEIEHPILLRHEPNTNSMWLITQGVPYGPSTVHRFSLSATERGLDPANDLDPTSRVDAFEDNVVSALQNDRVHYDLCFHPEYPRKPYLFVGLNESVGGTKHSRILRWELKSNSRHVEIVDEQVVLEWPSDGHNGAALTFGNDGMLYITSGDGTSDSDTNLRGQDLTQLTAKVLRIDIDTPVEGRLYSIPEDNPFLNRNNSRPETWAYGLRNPWRITTDTESGRIWIGQNGQDLWEQVYLGKRGANYGWSVMEGASVFYANRERGEDPFEPPVKDHHHSEARSLTGGIVYRAERQDLVPLVGAYIYGDYSTGKVWAIWHDGEKVNRFGEIADTPHAITSFEVTPGGEIWIADHLGKSIHRLIPNQAVDSSKDFPRRLSQTGLFQDVASHRLAPGIISYSVNSPLWSDGAYKERAFFIPAKGEGDRRIEFQNQFGWTFPNETVLIKSFALEARVGDPTSRRWIETRLMVRQQNEWVGYSYRWNDQGTDAELVDATGDDQEYQSADAAAAGGIRHGVWHFPSRAECMVCHSRAANFTLGLQTSQMNRLHDGGNGPENQLEALERKGLFKIQPQQFTRALEPVTDDTDSSDTSSRVVTEAMKLIQRSIPAESSLLPLSPDRLPKLVDPYDETLSLELRARSYLHANCASCHVPAGGGNASIELSYQTPNAKMGVFETSPRHQDFGIMDAKIIASGNPDRSVLLQRIVRRGNSQMPPIATNVVDARAAALIEAWITGLSKDQTP